MRRLLAFAIAGLLAVLFQTGCASTAAPKDDDAAWSDTCNGLRARLHTRLSHITNGTGIVVTHLELDNDHVSMRPQHVTLHRKDITYRVTDAEGRDVPPSGLPFSAPVVDPFELDLPRDSTIRFRVGPCGFGIPGDQAALVDLGPSFGRVLPRDGRSYYLSAVIDVPQDLTASRERSRDWHGRLDVPRVRIVTEPEPRDPATLGAVIDRLGATMLGANWDEGQEAVRELSLIDDPRVAPWYVQAMRTDEYDLMLPAMDRLSRIAGDAALEGVKLGMTTQGADIPRCASPAVASSVAENVRGAAAGALARSPHPQAKALLFSMEEDPARGVRLTVLQTAARMDTPASLALVERRTHDEDELVRGEAVRLLALRLAGGSSR